MSLQPQFISLRNASGKVGLLVGSGRASFRLGEALRKRGIIPFPLLLSDVIPFDLRVVIASEEFEKKIVGCKIVVWIEGSCPEDIVDRVMYLLYGENDSAEAIIGVDPGKEIGVAVVADGRILRTDVFESVGEATEGVLRQVSILPYSRKVVRVGSGGEEYSNGIMSALKLLLPSGVEIQEVEEWGTSRDALCVNHSRRARNAASAATIALRQGKPVPRGV